jgi:hypothetical protein
MNKYFRNINQILLEEFGYMVLLVLAKIQGLFNGLKKEIFLYLIKKIKIGF